MSEFPKKILGAMLVSMLLAAACGGGAETPVAGTAEDQQKTDEEAAGAPAKSEAPVEVSGELTIWSWEGTAQALQVVDEAFQEKYPNVELNYVLQDAPTTYQNIQLALTAGSGAPDVATIEDSHLAQFVKLGALADVTDRVEPYRGVVNDYKWRTATMDGRIYAMPWDSGPVAVFYRRDVFERAGVDPDSIETWDDYYAAAKTVKEETGLPMWQQAKARNDGRLFETLLWQRGLGYVDENGDVTLDKDPRVLETLEFMGRFWEEDLAADSEPWTDAWYREMNDAEVATVPGAVWMGTFLKSFIAPDTGGKWGVFRLPAWEPGGVRASNDGGSTLAIFEQSENKEAAWAYVEFHLGTVESQLAIYRETDIFPGLEEAYDESFFSEPDPYFDGQKVRSLFAEIVAEVPEAHVYTTEYQEMNELLIAEIQKYAVGRQSAEQALAAAAAAIRDRTGRS